VKSKPQGLKPLAYFAGLIAGDKSPALPDQLQSKGPEMADLDLLDTPFDDAPPL
jgi:hypothetical protein